MYESRGVCTAHATRIVCVCACGCTQTKTIYGESSLYQPAPHAPHPTDAGTHSGKCTWSLGLRIHDSAQNASFFYLVPRVWSSCWSASHAVQAGFTINHLGLRAAAHANANDPRDVRRTHATSVTRRMSLTDRHSRSNIPSCTPAHTEEATGHDNKKCGKTGR